MFVGHDEFGNILEKLKVNGTVKQEFVVKNGEYLPRNFVPGRIWYNATAVVPNFCN